MWKFLALEWEVLGQKQIEDNTSLPNQAFWEINDSA